MEDRLTDQEIQKLLFLLDKVNPLPFMQYPVIKKFWERRLVPLNPMELIILNECPFEDIVWRDASGEGVSPPSLIYLKALTVYRNDEYWPDCFHFPGGYLGSNETVADAIQRVAKKEIGVGIKNFWPVSQGNFTKLGRDHEYSTIFICLPGEEPVLKPGRQFTPILQLPKNLLPHHREMAKRAIEWLEAMQSLSAEKREKIIRVTSVLESSAEL